MRFLLLGANTILFDTNGNQRNVGNYEIVIKDSGPRLFHVAK